MSSRQSFEALQNRWASGETLSDAEERTRVELAALQVNSSRELELFAELGARLEQNSAPSPAFIQRTLAALRGARLRLVAPDELPSVSEKSARSWLRVAFAASAALVLAGGVAFALRGERPLPSASSGPSPARSAAPSVGLGSVERSELVFASGEVEVGSRTASIGKGTLAPGEHVRTRAGHACLTIDPQIDVCLERNTELVLDSLAEAGVRVRVLSGAVVAALTPRSAQRTFSLVHGDFTATAHGTVFAIAAGTAGRSPEVSVIEGKVEVSRVNGEARLLGAHASLALTPGLPEKGGVLGRSEEARFWSLLAPRELWQSKDLGVLEIGAVEAAQRVTVDERGPYALPLSMFVAARRHQLAVLSASGKQVNLDAQVEAGSVRHLSAPDLMPKTASTVEVAAKAPSAAALLDEARQKFVRGDARGARESYERLRTAYPASPEATTVLVTLGKLELDLGAPKRGLAAFDSYLKHGGPLGPEALSGKIRALRALGRESEERAAIELYLSRHANGFDAPALRNRLETLTRP